MDDERNNGGGAPENDFESQLAELIKQSGGSVPPKNRSEQENQSREESSAPREKTAEEIDAEIEAMINSMSEQSHDSASAESAEADAPASPFVMPSDEPSAGFAAPEDGAQTSAATEETTSFTVAEETPPFVMPNDSHEDSEQTIEDIMAEIDRLEREAANAEREKEEAERAKLEEEESLKREMAQNEKTSAALDDELEAMLESLTAETPAAEPVQAEKPTDTEEVTKTEQPLNTEKPAKTEETAKTAETTATEETVEAIETPKTEASAENKEPDEKPIPEPVETRSTKEPETAELFKEPVEIVRTDESHETSVPIDIQSFDKVEPPKEEPKPLDVATMEAMLQELLGDDRAKKEEKEQAVVSEMEQMRAKIASLEYMLANADRRKSEETADEKKAAAAPPQTDPQKIIEQAAKATKSDDINSMFKQWFDLEMAAKMKNIITEDEKKAASEKEKQPPYDKSPAVYNESDQGSDFIKLSDNVYYNVREKKTYVMRELKPTVSSPKKKVVKKKIVRKAAPRPRRALHARPGMRPRRPRRPLGSPRRRRP